MDTHADINAVTDATDHPVYTWATTGIGNNNVQHYIEEKHVVTMCMKCHGISQLSEAGKV